MTTPNPAAPPVGRIAPLPAFALTTDRTALPAELRWASEEEAPPINTRVDVTGKGGLGTGTVKALYWSDLEISKEQPMGELGVIVELDSVPDWMKQAVGESRLVHCLGDEFTRLDQGDEAEEAPGVLAPVGTDEDFADQDEFTS